MDVERALVSRIARTSTLGPILSRSIEPEHFNQRVKGDTSDIPLPGEVFGWILNHLRQWRSMPSWELCQVTFPRFEWYDTTDPLEVLVDKLVLLVKYRQGITHVRQMGELLERNDPREIADLEVLFFEIAAELARAVPSSSVTKLSNAKFRRDAYMERKARGYIPGISLVFPELDALTYGLQDHELMIWEGFLGTGKSSITMAQCAKAYLQEENPKTSLVFSLEMEGEKMAQRWDSMMAKFSYNNMRKLELTKEEEEAWERLALKAEASRFDRDILVIDDIQRCTADKIHAEVQRWRPDLIVVDTIDEIRAPSHLKTMYDQQRWAAMELKGIARAVKKPIIGVAQAGRDAEQDGATLGNIAGSIDIARKADIVVGLHATPAMKQRKHMELRMLKNRDGEGDGLSYQFYWNVGKMEFRSWTPNDAVPTPPQQAPAALVPAGAVAGPPAQPMQQPVPVPQSAFGVIQPPPTNAFLPMPPGAPA